MLRSPTLQEAASVEAESGRHDCILGAYLTKMAALQEADLLCLLLLPLLKRMSQGT